MNAPLQQHHDHPYNPWQSYVVEASAGSGKTWQLSRRFLALVIAGADPASILTVTFTKKAAAEMRERIVKDAIRLANHSDGFETFVAEIKKWQPADRYYPLRTAAEASRMILEKTQTLKITTIDALFIQWCQRYPLETAINIDDLELQSPWELLSNLELRRLHKEAWNDVLATEADQHENRNLMRSIIENAPGGKLRSLADAIAPLAASDTFSWYIEMLTGRDALRLFEMPESVDSDQEFISKHKDLFSAVIALASNEEKRLKAQAAIKNLDISGLVTSQIVTQSAEGLRLNGNTFGKAKKSNDPNFWALNDLLLKWSDDRRISDLNSAAKLIWTLYKARSNAVHRRKVAKGVGNFADAAKGVSILACEERLAGGRAMAWSSIRHLMLDEFQDTSRLQWLIFEKLAAELLSGQSFDAENGPKPSVFIVGDKKQSIYRFREAAPEVLDMARENLKENGLVSRTMSQSYRSSSIILDFVNKVFADGKNIADFPLHKSAVTGDVGEYGTVSIYAIKPSTSPEAASYISDSAIPDSDIPEPANPKSPASKKTTSIETAELEAKTAAQHIHDCVTGVLDVSVFDKDLESWRAPRYSDFAVLYPGATNSQIFEDAMRDLGIPSRRAESKGFFGRQEIKDLNALVTWLAWPADTVALCSVLRSPICGMLDTDLQQIISAGPDAILTSLKQSFSHHYDLLMDLRASQDKSSLSLMVGKLLAKYGIADRYELAFGPIEGPLAKSNVLKWFDMVRNGAAEQAIAAHTWSVALDDATEEDETGNASLATNAVTMMTIHKSKGLEFPCVVVTGSAKDWHHADSGWIKDSRPGQEGLWFIGSKKLRPSNSPQIDELLRFSEQESRDEKARLLYVALTRASQHIAMTGSPIDDPQAFFGTLQTAAESLSHSDCFAKKIENNFATGLVVTRKSLGMTGSAVTNRTKDSAAADNNPKPIVILGSNIPALKILTPSAMAGRSLSDTASQQGDAIDRSLGAATPRVLPALAATYGTVVHKLLECHIHGQHWGDLRLQKFTTGLLDRAISPESLLEFLDTAKAEAQTVISSIIWSKLTTNVQALHSEMPMAIISGDNLLNAKADLVIQFKNGSIKVIDFKTMPINPDHARQICLEKGYFEQVSQYCNITAQAFKTTSVSGHILFTNPVCLVDV